MNTNTDFNLGEDPIEAEAARKRKRNREEGRKQPNYKYKPTGKSPSQYFVRKINEVFKWTVEDSTDLNYGLRVLEGWMKQLKSYDWEIFKGKVAFDLDKTIKDVENLLKK